MRLPNSEPIYPISVAAKLLGIHPRTIRLYEEEGLIRPTRRGQKRIYSHDDIAWIECLRRMIHDEGISIPGIKKLLDLQPCWELRNCPPETREQCTAYKDLSTPCWERANSACAKDTHHCQSCDVFVRNSWKAMLKKKMTGTSSQ